MDKKVYKLGLTRNIFKDAEFAKQAKENILRWVKELETTKEKQGTDYLCKYETTVPHYCCLGIACEVFSPHNRKAIFANISVAWAGSHIHLGQEQKDMLGLRTEIGGWINNPLRMQKAEINSLTELNDVKRYSFKKIAAFIRGSFKGCTGEDLE